MSKQKKIIGIFALQGDFAEHRKVMEKLGAEVFLIHGLSDIDGKKLDGVILPGGESTTITKLLKKTGLDKWLIKQAKSGLPIFGTCAGMIVLAEMALIDADVERNAYGGQLESFEDDIEFSRNTRHETQGTKFNGIFIRAPKVKKIGPKVKVLAFHKKTPVLMRQNNVMVGSFHPELTDDVRVHEYFLEM